MIGAADTAAIVSLAEAQAYARVETGDEEALIAGLVRSASALCEAFLRQVVIQREFTVQVAPSAQWQRLTTSPVRSITAVAAGGAVLSATAYSTDIDADGSGWVRVVDPGVCGPIEVSGTAGIASTQNGVPEPIRQGVLRLVAHLFRVRDGEGADIPTAVTALWRPYRRMQIL